MPSRLLPAALLTLLPAVALAQGSRADYERADGLAAAWRKLDVPRFDGHWIDGSRLWYVTGSGADSALEIIDPAQSSAARRRSALLKSTFDGQRPLAVEASASDLLVLTAQGVHRWTPGAAEAELLDPGNAATQPLVERLRSGDARRSGRNGARVHLVFANLTGEPLDLSWVTGDGARRKYATIQPGTLHDMGTYASHVFELTDRNGVSVGWVRAGERSALVPVGLEAPDEPATNDGRRRARRRDRTDDDRADRAWSARLRDGALHLEPAAGGDAVTLEADQGEHLSGPLRWSPDGEHLVCWRVLPAPDHTVHIVESSPRDQRQPKLVSFEYKKPGDPIQHRWPVVVRASADAAPRILLWEHHALCPTPWRIDRLAWSADGRRVSFVHNQRGHRVVRLVSYDVDAETARLVIDESPETFVDYAHKVFLHRFPPTENGGEHVLWMTERSGWNHLILVDARTGEVVREVTNGPWVVRAVDHVDDATRTARLRVMGFHPGEDPYHVHYATVNVDTGALTLLTAGDGTHEVEFSPDGRWLLDRWSRVDLAPHAALRPADGEGESIVLLQGDTAPLEAAGWRKPERFVAKGRDGTTDIWGVVYRPTNHDPKKSYPVVERIYAGPHGAHVPKSFALHRGPQSLAELGFVVVQIDGMGTNWRSKAFHDVAWKNLGDAGFPDRVLWLRALAEHDPSIDLERVGIEGGSAGGQNAMRALITHNDVYDVAIADCGCHDNRMDKIWWNELWMSWPLGDWYDEASNVTQAHRMEGKLLLIVGELDRNVDPASTMQVADALVRADKDFDLLVIPGAGHGAAGTPYGRRRSRDYLVRHLLGREPRWGGDRDMDDDDL